MRIQNVDTLDNFLVILTITLFFWIKSAESVDYNYIQDSALKSGVNNYAYSMYSILFNTINTINK